jgi:SAM-dependent methyltransferase
VPGCGRGHDARFLASRGYDVVGFDFSPAAVSAARALAKRDRVAVTFEQRDIFTLAQDYAHAFDGVWEYTCYCAIDPLRRAAYVQTISSILKPGGWLWPASFPAPHRRRARLTRSTRAEVHRRFGLRISPSSAPAALRSAARPPRPRMAGLRPPRLTSQSR